MLETLLFALGAGMRLAAMRDRLNGSLSSDDPRGAAIDALLERCRLSSK